MGGRSSGPRRRPAPPHVQEKVRRVQARQRQSAITLAGREDKRKRKGQ